MPKTQGIIRGRTIELTEDIGMGDGQRVSNEMMPIDLSKPAPAKYPLRGTPIQFDDAVNPVVESDWESQS